jgi:hypothetical protein
MDTTYIISVWTDIIQYFFPIFTAPTTKIFLNLISGWILCTAKHTITVILPFAELDKSMLVQPESRLTHASPVADSRIT